MNKTLITALALTAGLGGTAMAQCTTCSVLVPSTEYKVGYLNISLANQYQSARQGVYYNGKPAAQPNWGSYADLWNCGSPAGSLGTLTYKTEVKAKTTTQTTITAINKGLANFFKIPGFVGSFTTSAQLVVINYENDLKAPPYNPWEQYVPYTGVLVPWLNVFGGAPYQFTGSSYDVVPLNWPNLNYTAWGRPFIDTTYGYYWEKARVFVLDPKNANANLQCFDVTPFFSFEEAFCWFCWDTGDRITDGSISMNMDTPPCTVTAPCAYKGSGTTKYFWTVKFNNVAPLYGNVSATANQGNANLQNYYSAWTANCYPLLTVPTIGVPLTDANSALSKDALTYNVSGIATYKWAYKPTPVSGTYVPVGTISMNAQGFGLAPFCGLYNGTVSVNEKLQN